MKRTGDLFLASANPIVSFLEHQQGKEAVLSSDQCNDLSHVEPGRFGDRIRNFHDFTLLPRGGRTESPDVRMQQAGLRSKGLLDSRIRRLVGRRSIHRSKMTDVPLSAVLPRADPAPAHRSGEYIRVLGQQIGRLTLDVVHPSIRDQRVRDKANWNHRVHVGQHVVIAGVRQLRWVHKARHHDGTVVVRRLELLRYPPSVRQTLLKVSFDHVQNLKTCSR